MMFDKILKKTQFIIRPHLTTKWMNILIKIFLSSPLTARRRGEVYNNQVYSTRKVNSTTPMRNFVIVSLHQQSTSGRSRRGEAKSTRHTGPRTARYWRMHNTIQRHACSNHSSDSCRGSIANLWSDLFVDFCWHCWWAAVFFGLSDLFPNVTRMHALTLARCGVTRLPP